MPEAPNDAPPLSPAMRATRAGFALLLVLSFAFCIVMAAWGGLREALMLRVQDHRLTLSFAVQLPDGTRLRLGRKQLGDSKVPAVAGGVNGPTEIEGMDAGLPRSYFLERDLLEQSVPCEGEPSVPWLAEKLAPGATLLWTANGGQGLKPASFAAALLKTKDGALDAVLLGVLEVPYRDGARRFGICLRAQHGELRLCRVARVDLAHDQLYAPPGEFWAVRESGPGLPPAGVMGQTKLVWRIYAEMMDAAEQQQVLAPHVQGEPKWAE